MKKITIITPSMRPHNLWRVKESIRFEYVNEWIIVYDGKHIHENPHLFKNVAESYKIKEYVHIGEGCSGNTQRNYALDIISNQDKEGQDTFIYFLDDDNIIHPDLYSLIHSIEPGYIYTFNQVDRIKGNNINLFCIDTAMFLVDFRLCGDIRWLPYRYNADGYYIIKCYLKNQGKWKYIDRDLSYYNKI
jgi:hypothetical protein